MRMHFRMCAPYPFIRILSRVRFRCPRVFVRGYREMNFGEIEPTDVHRDGRGLRLLRRRQEPTTDVRLKRYNIAVFDPETLRYIYNNIYKRSTEKYRLEKRSAAHESHFPHTNASTTRTIRLTGSARCFDFFRYFPSGDFLIVTLNPRRFWPLDRIYDSYCNVLFSFRIFFYYNPFGHVFITVIDQINAVVIGDERQ